MSPWAPPGDDELTWLPVDGVLPARPLPLEMSFGVYAFVYGLGHALDSLNFPLYDVRARRDDGWLYLAAVPSAMAEADLERRMTRMRDATLRFSRNIRAPWERAVRAEVAEYGAWMNAFPSSDASDAEVAAGLFTLKRTWANQWFAPFRAVIAPTAMLQAGIGETPPDEALAIVAEVQELVVVQGTATFDGALQRIAERLVRAGCLERPEDAVWLDYGEVGAALTSGTRQHAAVARRRQEAATPSRAAAAAVIGPPLPADAPRMYLLRETLSLIGVGLGADRGT